MRPPNYNYWCINVLKSFANLIKRRIKKIWQAQEVSAGILSWLEGQTDIFFCRFQPVHVQFEGLSVRVELRERLVHLWRW